MANAINELGVDDNRRFFISSYNGLYGKIKDNNGEVINNSVASVSFDTQRLNYIAGYSMFSPNDLSDVFDGNRQIYIIKNKNKEKYTDALLTGIDDYIIAEHSDVNKITIKTVGFYNNTDAAVWANTFLTNHQSDSNYVIISQFGSALYVFNNNDYYRCINVNICPNIPEYASYFYNVEYTDNLDKIYEWNIEDENTYVPFIPNNTICYYIDLNKPN